MRKRCGFSILSDTASRPEEILYNTNYRLFDDPLTDAFPSRPMRESSPNPAVCYSLTGRDGWKTGATKLPIDFSRQCVGCKLCSCEHRLKTHIPTPNASSSV